MSRSVDDASTRVMPFRVTGIAERVYHKLLFLKKNQADGSRVWVPSAVIIRELVMEG